MPGQNLIGDCLACRCPNYEDITIVISGVTDCFPCSLNGIGGSIKMIGASSVNGSWAVDSGGNILFSGVDAVLQRWLTPNTTCAGTPDFETPYPWTGTIECNGTTGFRIRITANTSPSPQTFCFAVNGNAICEVKPQAIDNDLASIGGSCGFTGGSFNIAITGTATLDW